MEQAAPERLTDENVQAEAAGTAEAQERNAWQADAGVDRLLLVALLLTVALAAWALYSAAAGRRRDGGLRPSAATGLAALVGALLVLYRTVQEPGFDDLGTVRLGPPLALVLLGVIAYGAATALPGEEAPAAAAEGEPGPAAA